jgi:hypothetical protein
VTDELDRIGQALEAELPVFGRGVAFFTCRKLGLWRQIAISVPLPDGAYVSSSPYLRPLARTRDEHDRFVLALLSRERSRFFVSQIGEVDEVFRVKGQRLRKILTDRVPRDRNDVLVIEAIKNEARALAHVADLVLAQFEGRYLLMAGAPELRAAVTQYLPKTVQQRLGGEFSADIHALPADVAKASEPVQRVIEEREEVGTVPAAARRRSQPVRMGRTTDARRFARGARCYPRRRRHVRQARGALSQLRRALGGALAELSRLW